MPRHKGPRNPAAALPKKTLLRLSNPDPAELSRHDIHAHQHRLHYEGKFDEAIRFLSRAIENEPTETLYLVDRSLCHLALHHYEEAVGDAKQAEAIEGVGVTRKTCHVLSVAYRCLGEADRALHYARSALAVAVTEEELRLTSEHDYTPAVKLSQDLDQFHRHVERGELYQARIRLEDLLKKSFGAQGGGWLRWKMELTLAQGDLVQAKAHCKQVRGHYTSNLEYVYMGALICFLRGEFDEAFDFLRYSLGINPEHQKSIGLCERIRDIASLLDSAKSAEKKGDLEAAVIAHGEVCDRIGAAPSEACGGWVRAESLICRTQILFNLGRFSDSSCEIPCSNEREPWAFRTTYLTAQMLFHSERYEEAAAAYRTAKRATEHLAEEHAMMVSGENDALLLLDWSYQEPCEILRVEPDATLEVITTAYRRLSLVHHPDKHVNLVRKAHKQQVFRLLRQAFVALIPVDEGATLDTKEGMTAEEEEEITGALMTIVENGA